MKAKHEERGVLKQIEKIRLGMAFIDNTTLRVIETEKKEGLDFNMQGLCQGNCYTNQ